MYKDGNYVRGTDKYVKDTPELAYYTKEGKVLNALKDARVKFEQSIILAQCKDSIQSFFKRYAGLSTDLEQTQHNLLSLAQNYEQGTINDSDLEDQLLGLFEQVVPEYSDEPIVKLLKSKYLKSDDPSKLIGLSLVKVQIFLILSS